MRAGDIVGGVHRMQTLSLSKATLQRIEVEIEGLVKTGYATAQRVLIEKRTELEVLAKGLLEYETLSCDEIKRLLAGKLAVREAMNEPGT